ncbi:MAG: efflux RND transporter periplasmic adaptor subunit [Pseudomonadota bacterium]
MPNSIGALGTEEVRAPWRARWAPWGAVMVLAGLTAGCIPEEKEEPVPPPIRGLVTVTVEETSDTTVRRYPGVMEPGEVNVLSFEVSGRLQKIDLSVGQRITDGQTLATLDSAQFRTTVENREAAIDQTKATLAQAEDDLARSETLFASGTVTKVRRDEDLTEVRELEAQLRQNQQDLAEAQEDLEDTVLTAPFDGIISAVEVDSFATVSSGETILTIYEEDDFEVDFSVSFDVASRLVVGTPASVRLADDPTIVLGAVVTELGERADTVSSFPVTVTLEETHPIIKSGMSVEVAFEFEVPADQGFLIPITAAIPEGQIPPGSGPDAITPLPVYVYDPATSTVTRRIVTMAGLRGNQLLIIEGLEPGERVATKGVAFLREGMEVKLIENEG